MTTLPANLAQGAIVDGLIVLEVIDGAKSQYILGSSVETQLADLKQRLFTAEELLGKRKAIRLNRSPSNTDQYELGTVWEDVSFSDAYPLRFISIGDGVWQYLNEIKLRAIRIFVTSVNASYPQCRNVRFVDKDGVTIPYNNWVVGARSANFYAPPQGSIYTGGGSQEPYSKQTGWFELEPAAGFDYTRGIKEGWATLRGDTASTSLGKIELHFNSGAVKSITSTLVNFSGDKQFVALPQPEAFQYGYSVAALMGEQLTPDKLSDPNSNDYGRISGAAFVSAFNQLLAPLMARVKALEPPAVLALTIEKGFPSPDQSTARLTPPEGKAFKPGSLFAMLNRIAPDNASISQGTGGTDTYNFATPTEPGTYMLIMQPTYDDNSTGDIRETFTIP